LAGEEEETPLPTTPAPALDLPANIRNPRADLNLAGAELDVNGVFDNATIQALEVWQGNKQCTIIE
jgi:hypothetical protein